MCERSWSGGSLAENTMRLQQVPLSQYDTAHALIGPVATRAKGEAGAIFTEKSLDMSCSMS